VRPYLCSEGLSLRGSGHGTKKPQKTWNDRVKTSTLLQGVSRFPLGRGSRINLSRPGAPIGRKNPLRSRKKRWQANGGEGKEVIRFSSKAGKYI